MIRGAGRVFAVHAENRPRLSISSSPLDEINVSGWFLQRNEATNHDHHCDNSASIPRSISHKTPVMPHYMVHTVAMYDTYE